MQEDKALERMELNHTLTRRCLQLVHPPRDLLWGFRVMASCSVPNHSIPKSTTAEPHKLSRLRRVQYSSTAQTQGGDLRCRRRGRGVGEACVRTRLSFPKEDKLCEIRARVAGWTARCNSRASALPTSTRVLNPGTSADFVFVWAFLKSTRVSVRHETGLFRPAVLVDDSPFGRSYPRYTRILYEESIILHIRASRNVHSLLTSLILAASSNLISSSPKKLEVKYFLPADEAQLMNHPSRPTANYRLPGHEFTACSSTAAFSSSKVVASCKCLHNRGDLVSSLIQ